MKQFLFTIALLSYINGNAYCVINCKAKYLKKVPEESINVGSFYGNHIGKVDLYAPTGGVVGQSPYKWSDSYFVNVHFYSGYEYNEAVNGVYFNDNAIVAYIEWSNGGSTTIEIEGWTTSLKYITKEEVTIDYSTNTYIDYFNGYDHDKSYWQVTFNN